MEPRRSASLLTNEWADIRLVLVLWEPLTSQRHNPNLIFIVAQHLLLLQRVSLNSMCSLCSFIGLKCTWECLVYSCFVYFPWIRTFTQTFVHLKVSVRSSAAPPRRTAPGCLAPEHQRADPRDSAQSLGRRYLSLPLQDHRRSASSGTLAFTGNSWPKTEAFQVIAKYLVL